MSLMVSYFVLSFSHEMSLMRYKTELNQFLRTFLPTLEDTKLVTYMYCFYRARFFMMLGSSVFEECLLSQMCGVFFPLLRPRLLIQQPG